MRVAKEPWEWWFGGVLLILLAATHILASLAVGRPVGGLAVASLVVAPALMLKSRAQARWSWR